MNLSLKNKIVIAIAFGVYQTLINLFFDSKVFLKEDLNLLLYLGYVFTSSFLIEFLIIHLSIKESKRLGKNKIMLASSFLLSGIVAGSIIWLVCNESLTNYFIFVTAFIVSSFLPTVIALLLFLFKEAEDKISSLSKITVKKDEISEEIEDKIFHLENDNGKLLIEVKIKNIICFEANDNYVITYFLDKNEHLKKSMERISLKKIEDMLIKEEVFFKRVHKSFLINSNYIIEVKGKAQAYKIEMLHFDTLVPVSRSYDVNQLLK
jgi:hypothetical protein